jgi:hypothetical protein
MSTLELLVLVVVATVCLAAVASRVASFRTKPARRVVKHKIRLLQSDGQRRLIVDGAEVSDGATITDPVIRDALSKAEQAIHQLKLTS